jgi:hypothetical protein
MIDVRSSLNGLFLFALAKTQLFLVERERLFIGFKYTCDHL